MTTLSAKALAPAAVRRYLSALAVAGLLSGCAGPAFLKMPTQASITERRVNLDSGLTSWGENRVVRVGSHEYGYYGVSGATPEGGLLGFKYLVEPGQSEVAVWYYDNSVPSVAQARRTRVQTLMVELRPNGHYELRSLRRADKLQFRIVDVETNMPVAVSPWVDVTLMDLPLPPAGG
jgi:hypothetical protein